MFKWLGQVHVVYAKHSNWLVKVASAFAVAFGGITGFNWGATRLFLWLCGSACLSTQVRLQILDNTLEFYKTLLAKKRPGFFHKNLSDWPVGKLHSLKWFNERRTAWFLR